MKNDLPPTVMEEDLKYPETGRGLGYTKLQEMGLDHNTLTFYKTAGFGWVLTTLAIGGASRGQAARTYGITCDSEKLCRVGQGPHVTKQVTVYLSQDNMNRLQKYAELWKKGMGLAGQTRDRISTRRAQGQIYRAQGRTHWYW